MAVFKNKVLKGVTGYKLLKSDNNNCILCRI